MSCVSESVGLWWIVSLMQQMRFPLHMQAIQSHLHSPGQANLVVNEVMMGATLELLIPAVHFELKDVVVVLVYGGCWCFVTYMRSDSRDLLFRNKYWYTLLQLFYQVSTGSYPFNASRSWYVCTFCFKSLCHTWLPSLPIAPYLTDSIFKWLSIFSSNSEQDLARNWYGIFWLIPVKFQYTIYQLILNIHTVCLFIYLSIYLSITAIK